MNKINVSLHIPLNNYKEKLSSFGSPNMSCGTGYTGGVNCNFLESPVNYGLATSESGCAQ